METSKHKVQTKFPDVKMRADGQEAHCRAALPRTEEPGKPGATQIVSPRYAGGSRGGLLHQFQPHIGFLRQVHRSRGHAPPFDILQQNH